MTEGSEGTWSEVKRREASEPEAESESDSDSELVSLMVSGMQVVEKLNNSHNNRVGV